MGDARSVPDTGPGRVHHVAVAAVVAAGAALRFLHLDQPIRYDEAVTYLRYVSRPLPEALVTYDLPNNHLFHTLLAHVAVDVLGETPRALRLPAWAAGSLVVPATYLVGRAVRGPRAGLLAAALAAGSPVLVLFSSNARGYSLVVLAFLAMVLAASTLARRRSPSAWSVFVTAAALGAWTIPVMVYPAVAAAAWWIAAASSADRSALRSAAEATGAGLAAAGLAALLYLPVIREAGVEAVVANRFVTPRPWEAFVASVPGFLAEVAAEWCHGVPAWAGIPVAAGGVVEGLVRLRGRRGGPPSLLPVAFAASLVVLAASRRTPFARVWLFLLPTLLIFGAAGLVRLADAVTRRVRPNGRPVPGRGHAVTGLALAGALSLGWTVGQGNVVSSWGLTGSLPSGDRVAGFLAERWTPGDAVRARVPSDAPLQFYFRVRGLPPSAVDGDAGPGSCLWVVVNRRHGQTLSGLAPDRYRPSRGDPEPVRSWEGAAVYALPPVSGAGRSAVADACGPPDRAGWWRRARPSDTFAATGPSDARPPVEGGGRVEDGETTETAGVP